MSTYFSGDHYQIDKQIGMDLMTVVYRARDMHTDRIVALKVLRDHYSADPKLIALFERGAKVQAALQHPNIIQVYDFDQADGHYFMAMELIEGTDLRRYLRSHPTIISVERSVSVAREVAVGLGAIRLGRMQVNQEARVQLPPIFGEKPLFIPIRADSLLSPDLTLWEYPPSPSPEERMPEVFYFTPEAYHQRLQDRRERMQQSTSIIRKTILLGDAVADVTTLHDSSSEWLR